MTNIVQVACWDLSSGFVETGFGKWLANATSSSQEMVPEAIDHVGIIVFGCLFEYGNVGIFKDEVYEDEELESEYTDAPLRCFEEIGNTSKTLEEFEEWISVQNEGKYSGSNYDIVTNSCINWAIAACEFLGVPHPSNLDKMLDWVTGHEKLTKTLNWLAKKFE